MNVTTCVTSSKGAQRGVSSIGILNGPFTTAMMLVALASPGLAAPPVPGRGALVCCGIWLFGMAYFTNNF
jgi:hypothetical protein